MKRHKCEITETLIKEIEYVLPKLKYSVYINQIRYWLENFEENEVEDAFEFLFYLDYIPFSELQYRLNYQLGYLIKSFPGTTNFVFVPYAKYPKSSDIVLYLLAKCDTFLKLQKLKQASITADLTEFEFEGGYLNTVVVFVDDFIGSGQSFHKWYRRNRIFNKLASSKAVSDRFVILGAIIMEDAYEFLKCRYPEMDIFAEYRTKIFSKENSPFNLTGKREQLRRLCMKYGSSIKVDFQRPNKTIFRPLGYSGSEALVAFDYGTPNNSLSIIWGDDKWYPIFPRRSNKRMQKAVEIKKEAAFFRGLIYRLGISEEQYEELSRRDETSIIVYLSLLDKQYSNLQISQILGVTLNELDKIISKARAARFVNKQGSFTKLGLKLITEIKANKHIHNFRKNDDFQVHNETIFVPKTFGKVT